MMTSVVAPLARPAIAAVALFQLLYAWNDLGHAYHVADQ